MLHDGALRILAEPSNNINSRRVRQHLCVRTVPIVVSLKSGDALGGVGCSLSVLPPPLGIFGQSIRNKYFRSGPGYYTGLKRESGAGLDFALELCVYSISAVKGFRRYHARLLE
jgi:hypothetical protein